MTRLNVTPTRMNLNTLKKRLATSKRGYKLLKDKQDELMRQFLEKIRENKRLREEVEADLKDSSKGFLMAFSNTKNWGRYQSKKCHECKNSSNGI